MVVLVFSCLGDAKETDRHLFLYNALADVIFVSAVAAAIAHFTRVGAPRGSEEIAAVHATRNEGTAVQRR